MSATDPNVPTVELDLEHTLFLLINSVDLERAGQVHDSIDSTKRSADKMHPKGSKRHFPKTSSYSLVTKNAAGDAHVMLVPEWRSQCH